MTDKIVNELLDALVRDDVSALRSLLARGIDANARIQDQPALTIAVSHGHLAAARLLLDRGADANARNKDSETALMTAALNGNTDIARLLVERGADIGASNDGGFTAYDFARSGGNMDLMSYLSDKGGKPGYTRTVLVLGAGFTKGFYARAPLLVDSFGVRDKLLKKYREFEPAREILSAELELQELDDGRDRGRINLERLMTRLAGGMPYDQAHQATPVLAALLADLKQVFVDRIREARQGENHVNELLNLGKYCAQHRTTIVTFNYDDLLDAALEKSTEDDAPKWLPSYGYGFHCRPVGELIGSDLSVGVHGNSRLLLKLHGSMNWHARRGAAGRLGVRDIVHDSPWSNTYNPGQLDPLELRDLTGRHISPEPFIIPPVLTKAELVEQPLFQLIWGLAYDAIREADQVTFVGYSLPITDIAASQMFAEACRLRYPKNMEVRVVDFADKDDDAKRQLVMETYRRLFAKLPDNRFQFDGSLAWAKQFVANDGAELKAPAPRKEPDEP